MELWVVNSSLTTYKSFERYLRLYEQEQIIANEKDVEALCLGLTSFPRLKRITITPKACQPSYFFPHYETPFFSESSI